MKTCKSCRAKFQPVRPMQSVCSTSCAINLAERKAHESAKKAAAEDRKRTRAALVKLKSRAQLVKEAQTAFNAWVRARDAHLPCVSCDKPPTWQGQWHASHFFSTAARPDLRLDPANVHKSCSVCNNHLSGNLIPYRAELIRRIGQAEVDRLEGPPNPDKLTRDELIAIRATYLAKTLAKRKETDALPP